MPQPPAPDEIRDQLERILRSETFRYSERTCRLLGFLVEHTLDRRTGPLKEYVIGLRVFDRPDSFDPRTYSIVRVEASRLRLKLRDYYLGEGAQDPVSIRLPERGYRPEFTPNPPPPASVVGGSQQASALVAAAPEFRRETVCSVAVLPFLDPSPARTEEYFCDGMIEELINALTQTEGIRVIPRTSAFQTQRECSGHLSNRGPAPGRRHRGGECPAG